MTEREYLNLVAALEKESRATGLDLTDMCSDEMSANERGIREGHPDYWKTLCYFARESAEFYRNEGKK